MKGNQAGEGELTYPFAIDPRSPISSCSQSHALTLGKREKSISQLEGREEMLSFVPQSHWEMPVRKRGMLVHKQSVTTGLWSDTRKSRLVCQVGRRNQAAAAHLILPVVFSSSPTFRFGSRGKEKFDGFQNQSVIGTVSCDRLCKRNALLIDDVASHLSHREGRGSLGSCARLDCNSNHTKAKPEVHVMRKKKKGRRRRGRAADKFVILSSETCRDNGKSPHSSEKFSFLSF